MWFELNILGYDIDFRPKFLLRSLLLLILSFGFIGILLFFVFKIYSILFIIARSRLGISDGVVGFIWLTATLCSNVNIPLSWHMNLRINVIGGLMPTILALYQFSRVEANPIFVVMVIVATISFFSVVVLPELGIFAKFSTLTIISLVAALSAISIATATDQVGVAFAGGVLGVLIGADLLHLRDLQLENSLTPLSIGGAGMNDGIIRCGFYALLFAEYLPKLAPFLKDIAKIHGFTLHF